MVVSLADLQADCGEVYDNLNNGTTAASSLITKAGSKISVLTGTTTGYDSPIRNLADAYVCNQVLGSSSSSDFGIGPIRVGRTQIREMRDLFLESAKEDMASLGYTLSTKNLMFEAVNQ